MATLRPLSNTVLFQFLDRTDGKMGSFTERTRSGLIIPTVKSTQKVARWGTVVAVGPKVEGLEPGDFIMIEALMWTRHEVFEGQKIWKTNDEKILFVTNDIALTVMY